MKPHPLGLRQRIVADVDRQEHTIEEVVALVDVGEHYVYQLLKARLLGFLAAALLAALSCPCGNAAKMRKHMRLAARTLLINGKSTIQIELKWSA
jgi:hypothetical protein